MIKGKTVAAIITDGFHNTELTDPMHALQKAGAKVVVIAVSPDHLKAGVLDHETWLLPENMRPAKRQRADLLIDDARPEEYHGLLVPGGFSPERLRTFPKVVAFIKSMHAARKPIAAICHGAQILISAEVVKGKRMTCVPTIAVDLKNAGAQYVDEALAVDGNLVTSRTPKDMQDFISGFERVLDAS
jgi:protease I